MEKQVFDMEYDFVVYMASLVENKDGNANEHVKRITQIVRCIGNELLKRGMYKDIVNEQYLQTLLLATPLHDIGKIIISDRILDKPGRLTKEEFDEMKKHAAYGGEIVREAFGEGADKDFVSVASDVASYHHEKYNGDGYPEGLEGEEIPLSARIVTIADVYDALSGKRCYKEPLPLEEVYEIMNEDAGKQFDPALLEVFMDIRDEIKNEIKCMK